MNKYMLYLNTMRCIGCYGCEVHCKTHKRLPVGPFLCEISHEPLNRGGGIPQTEFHFRSCYHCEHPSCVSVCPTGAMRKRADGIVFVDQKTCTGCQVCVGACPWSVPQKNPATGKVVKCDYCMDRIDAGLKPSCVTRCAAKALKLVVLQAV